LRYTVHGSVQDHPFEVVSRPVPAIDAAESRLDGADGRRATPGEARNILDHDQSRKEPLGKPKECE
jgi:hypothetical protein